jgi:hypothetical protein
VEDDEGKRMKEEELRRLATCAVCGKKLGASIKEHRNLPIFWKVTAQRFLFDDGAMRRQAGLEMMVGHVGLAQALSPNEDLAQPMDEKPIVFSVCDHCALESTSHTPIGAVALTQAEKEVKDEDEREEG